MVTKKQLEANLDVMRQKMCAYIGSRCDCKFGGQNVGSHGESGNGCPEIHVVLSLLYRMKQSEYNAIMTRTSRRKPTPKSFKPTEEMMKAFLNRTGAK